MASMTCWMVLAGVAGVGPLTPIAVDGCHFTIKELRSDTLAYGNRRYVWKQVPERFAGWQYTQTCGGRPTVIEFTAAADGDVFLTTAERYSHIVPGSWSRVPDCSFYYTDGGRTRMAVFTRPVRKGERIEAPQGNWTGGILLAPELVMGRRIRFRFPPPPGVVIDRSPDTDRCFVGSPSIAVLPDGSYVASHDWFGPGTSADTTVVFGSRNQGLTWRKLSEIKGQFWSTLFVHRKALYVIGAGRCYGPVVIRRSDDGGKTWTTPSGPDQGLLSPEPTHHCAPVPVLVHKGRVWRAMEDRHGKGGWGRHFRAFVMSAAVDSDLLAASSWTFSNRLAFDHSWRDGPKMGWLEGNVVAAPDGRLLNILRFECPEGETAAVLSVSPDGRQVAFDPKTGFVSLPGGRAKFTIRFDPVSKRYWSLVTKQRNPVAGRNHLVLVSSAELRDWRVEATLLTHHDAGGHAFQYPDWVFEKDDIIAVSRTAWGDAHNAHDANYLTFHRIRHFRSPSRRSVR